MCNYIVLLQCKEYNNGVITGDLCYSICIEKSIPLHYCVSQTHSDIVSYILLQCCVSEKASKMLSSFGVKIEIKCIQNPYIYMVLT